MLKKVMADKLWRGVRQALPDGAVEGGVKGEGEAVGCGGKYVRRGLTGRWRSGG